MDRLNRSLKIIREYHRLKQNVLAEKLGVSASYLSEIERGIKEPTIDILRKYSDVFGIPLSSIMLFSEARGHSDRDMTIKFAEKALKILEWAADTDVN